MSNDRTDINSAKLGATLFVPAIAMAMFSWNAQADFVSHDIFARLGNHSGQPTTLVGHFVYNTDDSLLSFDQQEFFQVVSFSWKSPNTNDTYTIDEAQGLIWYAPLAALDPDANTSRDVLASGLPSGLGTAPFIDSVTGKNLSISPFVSGDYPRWFEDGFGFGAKYHGTYATRFVASFNALPVPPAVWLFGSGVLGFIGIARKKKTALSTIEQAGTSG